MEHRRCHFESPVGRLLLVANDVGLTHLLLAHGTLADAGFDQADAPEDADHPILARATDQLSEYFDGERTAFDLPLDLGGSSFERDAWLALADIPYGETISYKEQAEAIGRAGAFRAVGAANGRNPIAIVLPCHRVVGSDGSLVGFGGGIAMKRSLLELESGVQALPF